MKFSNIIIAIICLFLTSGAVYYLQSSARPPSKKQSLAESLSSLPGWDNAGDIKLSKDVIEALKLDDFLFRNYSNGKDELTLYIGYYVSMKKVGAAHDPMVCFPGQGWVLSDIDTGNFQFDESANALKFSTMIAQREGKKEFLLYWFQGFDQVVPDTFSQKIALLKNKFLRGEEDNAFVRISIPMEGKTSEEGRKVILSFVEKFYPQFLAYVRSKG